MYQLNKWIHNKYPYSLEYARQKMERRFILESLSSDVTAPDLARDDLKPFLPNQAPNSPVPSSNLEMQFVLYCPGTTIFFLSTSSLIIACNWSPWADRELQEWRNYTHLCPLGCPENTGPVFGTVISGTEGVTEDVGTMSNTEQGETHFTWKYPMG